MPNTPGVMRHIIIREIEHHNIFIDSQNNDHFIDRLERLLPKTQSIYYALAMYNFNKSGNRVLSLLGIDKEPIYAKGRHN